MPTVTGKVDPTPAAESPSHAVRGSSAAKAAQELAGLYDGFEAYRTPTSADYAALLTSGMVVLDANVLIDLYRYQKNTRDEFLAVLDGLRDQLWIPNQVIEEFWQNRDNIIADPREVDKTARELRRHLASADRDLRYWAKRVRLPAKDVQELANLLDEAFAKVVAHVQEQAVDDGRQFARETNGDPLIARLEPVLEGRVGRPFGEVDYKSAVAEAQRRGKERIPPGYMDKDKEGSGPAGDYLLWAQTLIEAKKSQRDVLFVTSDNKEDWWRKDKDGESLGPRPELAEEMRSVTGRRLFMLPPDSLLDRARDVLGIHVSNDSVQDVKETSQTSFDNEEAEVGFAQFEEAVQLSILKMGYEVYSSSVTDLFDYILQDSGGRSLYLELKYFSARSRDVKYSSERPITTRAVTAWFNSFLQIAERSPLPVLLVTDWPVRSSDVSLINRSGNVDVITWRGAADDEALSGKLREMFAR